MPYEYDPHNHFRIPGFRRWSCELGLLPVKPCLRSHSSLGPTAPRFLFLYLLAEGAGGASRRRYFRSVVDQLGCVADHVRHRALLHLCMCQRGACDVCVRYGHRF
uniref:Uncharacterized protein n=1 Tax=Ciona intestinalis TaxID=7719 RepID=H2XWS0_CIOIN